MRILHVFDMFASRRKQWPMVGAAAAAIVSVAALGAVSVAAGAAAPSQVVLAYTGVVNTLDPQQSNYGQTELIDSALYDALVTYSSPTKLVGALASSFALSPSATSVSITLRPGATFHDGTPVTATDVKYSLDRYKRLGNGIGGLLSDYKSTTIKDSSHLTIKLAKADSLFLGFLSKGYILNSKLVLGNAGTDDGQAWLADHDAGTGPYALAPGTTNGGNIVANRYAGYWAFSARRPAALVLRRIDQSSTQRAELKAGAIAYANNLSVTDALSFKGSSVETGNLSVSNQQYMYFNVLKGPTANVQVRRALQVAFDYAGALKAILHGNGQIAQGPLPLGMSCEAHFPPFAQNLVKAKAMLAKAGYANLTLTMRYQPDIADQAQEAVLYQSDLKKIGVTLNLVPITFADYLTLLSNKTTIPQMMLLADNAQVPNAGSFLEQFLGPHSQGTNRAGYSNAKVNALLNSAATTSNATKQCADYVQAQKLIYADAVAVDLFSIPWPVAYQPYLKGVVAGPTVTPISLATLRVG